MPMNRTSLPGFRFVYRRVALFGHFPFPTVACRSLRYLYTQPHVLTYENVSLLVSIVQD